MTTPPMFDLTGALRAGYKDLGSSWRAFMGIPDEGGGTPRSLRDFGRQPADEAWVYACMNIRAGNAAGIPLRVQVLDGKEWVDSADTGDAAAADLQFLLDDVNPAWEGSQLQAYSEAGAAVHGGSYWRKVRGKLGGPPQELYWLSGADVTPRFVDGGAFPSHYDYQPAGATVAERYRAKDIIAHRDTVNLGDPYALLSPLSAARFDISSLRASAETNAAVINNWGIPPGAWVAGKDVDLGPTEKNMIRRALAAVRGPKNQGKVPILPAGLTWVPLALNQKDADWIGAGKVSRMAVCAVLGVPLVLAGDDEKAGVYASVRDAERLLWRLTLIPGLDRRASRLDSWLVPDFDKTRRRLRVRYDYSGIEALRAAPAEDMQQFRGFVAQGLPLNRALARYGERPVEGGDEPRFPDLNGSATGAGVESEEADARPTEYAEKAVTLPDRLYRDASVKAYIAGGDPAVLRALVPDHLVNALAEGIRRRDSAEQIQARFSPANPKAVKYSDDQPRDENGRWEGGGSSTGGADGGSLDARLAELGIGTFGDMAGVDAATTAEIANTLASMKDQHPELFSEDIRLSVEMDKYLDAHTYAMANARWEWNDDGDRVFKGAVISLNPEKFAAGREALMSSLSADYAGNWLAGDSVEHLVAHEFGHVVDMSLGSEDYLFSESTTTPLNSLSTGYARTSTAEAFAEHFAVLATGGTLEGPAAAFVAGTMHR